MKMPISSRLMSSENHHGFWYHFYLIIQYDKRGSFLHENVSSDKYISFTGAAIGALPCFDGGQGTFTYKLSGK